MEITEKVIRDYIKTSLHESKGEADLVDITFRLRVRVSGEKDPKVVDIMTNIRCVVGVAICRQLMPVQRIQGGRDVLQLGVKFMSSGGTLSDSLEELSREIKKIDGVDIVMVLTVGGREIRRKGGAPYIF